MKGCGLYGVLQIEKDNEELLLRSPQEEQIIDKFFFFLCFALIFEGPQVSSLDLNRGWDFIEHKYNVLTILKLKDKFLIFSCKMIFILPEWHTCDCEIFAGKLPGYIYNAN
jgi:hypothetical protein